VENYHGEEVEEEGQEVVALLHARAASVRTSGAAGQTKVS